MTALPTGFSVGHFTDRDAWTGCTVVIAPEGTVASCEVRGGGPGTRESDLLSPAAAAVGVDALLLTGGSAFGLAAADGVVGWLAEEGRGFQTRAARVPLVAAAVVYDLALGRHDIRPDAVAAHRACTLATAEPELGSVGAGTGCTVGKILGPSHWTKGGLALASAQLAGGALVTSLAVVNAFGDVIGENGAVLAGVWQDGAYVRTVDLLRNGTTHHRAWRESTTLVCVMTNAQLTKTEAWLVARASHAGIARAVEPAATAVDGDAAYCLAAGQAVADPLAVCTVAADVTSQAIREAVRCATPAPDCQTAGARTSAGS